MPEIAPGTFVDFAAVDERVAATREQVSQAERCPKCNGEVIHGFGLMGGGYGPFVICAGHCDWMLKHGLSEDEE